jgi:DNA-binding GntR family transcriptional regulator
VQIWRTIWPRIRAYFFRYGRGQNLKRMVDEHRDLLAALQTRDPEVMLGQLERHIAVPVPASVAATKGLKGDGAKSRAIAAPRKAKP